MKQLIRQPILADAVERTRNACRARPALRTALRAAGYALCALALSGAALLGAPLPLAACLIAAAPTGAAQLGALAGAMAGYGLFWGLYVGLEGMAAALLVFSCARIFAPTPYVMRLWFAPGAAAAMTAVISGLFALTAPSGAQAAALLGAKILLAAVGTVGFRRAIGDGDRYAGLFALSCVLLGLGAAALPAGMTLGMVAAAGVAVCAAGSASGAVVAGVCGLAVELSGAHGAAAAFLLAGTACLAFGARNGLYRAAVFTVSATAALLVLGDATLALIPAAALGAAASIPLPALLFPARQRADGRAASTRERLESAANALTDAARSLTREEAASGQADAAAVFDRTADAVCRCCGGFARCWEQNAAETCRALTAAAPGMLARGRATREDLPPGFRCSRPEAFTRALSEQIDALRRRRMYQAGYEQTRSAAAGQLAILGAFLRETARLSARAALRPDRYCCELFCRSAGRGGGGVSGDRTVSVRGPGGQFYILLCDGMGTGEAAAQEARAASDLLAGLLRAGAAPGDAVALLDTVCALRGACGFATVDLFAADLITGECALYKKGAAPSLCRRGRRVGMVGTATPPPGYAAGGSRQPGRFALSLGEEDLLVMVSDGVSGEAAAACLAGWSGGTPDELAGSLIAGCTQEDDATAVVISLRPRATG